MLLLLAGIAAAIGWGILRKNEPPKVNFARVKRQSLVSLLPTNGKVEPFEWQAAHSEAAGIVSRLEVHEGQRVAKGAVLAVLIDLSRQAEIGAAEAKLAEADPGVAAVESGGRPAELTDIENRLARARFDQQQATIEANTLQRLLDKEAAPESEVQAARDKAQQARLEMKDSKSDASRWSQNLKSPPLTRVFRKPKWLSTWRSTGLPRLRSALPSTGLYMGLLCRPVRT